MADIYQTIILAGRPPCPYVPGWTMQLRHHTPPPPFNIATYQLKPEQYFYDARNIKLCKISRMEGVLNSPPLNQAPGDGTACTINITNVVVGGDLIGPQVVVCTVQSGTDQPTFTAVAKIYDPLYYRYSEVASSSETEASPEILLDPARRADGDYSREAAAYQQLQAHNTHGCTAKYHGSYTFDLAAGHRNLPGVTKRQVRLILIEHLEGVSMQELQRVPNEPGKVNYRMWQEIDEGYRMAVWARFLEASARLHHAQVYTYDDYPRNRMIVPPPPQYRRTSSQQTNAPQLGLLKATTPSACPPRVVIVDFGQSVVWSRSDEEYWQSKHRNYKNDLPTNPLIGQWNEVSVADQFRGWLPEWYFTNHSKRHEWLKKTFINNGEGGKYMKVEQTLKVGKKLAEQ